MAQKQQSTDASTEERKTTSVASEIVEVPGDAGEPESSEDGMKDRIYNVLFGFLILGFIAVCGLTVMFFIFPECSIPMRSCRTETGVEWFIGTKKRTRRESYDFCSFSDSIIANISVAEKILSENKEMLEKFGNFWLYDSDYEGELLIRSNGLKKSTKSMAYYRPDKCITFQTDDQKALYECMPSDNYEYFMMLTIKEACFPMKPIWASTMESIDIRVDADILKAVNRSRIDYINLQNHEIYNPRFCLTDRCCSMSTDKEVKQFREHEKFYPLCVKL